MTSPARDPRPSRFRRARFRSRPNRFLVEADFDTGEPAIAYLPNTGRLTHVMVPGNRLVLRHDPAPHRSTEWTVVRAWDGCWVALEAASAPGLLADWLRAGGIWPGEAAPAAVRREVALGPHRIDLVLDTAEGPLWVEVKSGGRAFAGSGLLSRTPSSRAAAHLDALAAVVRDGGRAAVAFVVQRPDVRELVVGGDADPGWIDAVRHARDAGVGVFAFRCRVTPTRLAVAGRIPVTWAV